MDFTEEELAFLLQIWRNGGALHFRDAVPTSTRSQRGMRQRLRKKGVICFEDSYWLLEGIGREAIEKLIKTGELRNGR